MSQPQIMDNYPSKIPDYFADIFIQKGGAQLPTLSKDGSLVQYNFDNGSYYQRRPPQHQLYRSASSIALVSQSPGLSFQSVAAAIVRPYTPQPTRPQPMASSIAITPGMQAQATRFTDIVRKYHGDSKFASAVLTSGQRGDFTDLEKDLEQLMSKYTDASDSSNKVTREIRLWLRRTAGATDGVNSWLRLLPGDSKELSVLVGGISIAFDASAKLDKVRMDSYEILDRIPEILRHASEYCKNYRDSPKITDYVSRLYTAILKALGDIVEWCSKSSIRKVVGALAKGSSYGHQLQDSFKALLHESDNIEKEADLLLHGTLKGACEKLQTVDNTTVIMRQSLQELCRDSERMLLMEEYLCKQILEKADAEKEQAARQAKLQQTRREHIIRSINFQPQLAASDRITILRNSLAFPRHKQGFAASILHTDTVKQWLDAPEHGALGINANDGDQILSTISMASVLLLSILDKCQPDTVSLSWFCALHTSGNPMYDMIVSLIGQLCQSRSFAADLVSKWSDTLQRLREYSQQTQTLIEIFTMLLHEQLQHSAVYLIIDSASFYESWSIYQQSRYFFEGMVNLTKFRQCGEHEFKLLLTSPRKLTDFSKLLGQEQIVNMQPLQVQDAASHLTEFREYLAAR